MRVSDAPVVRLVNLMLQEACALRASHIILRPAADSVGIVYVIDGAEVPRDLAPRRMLSAIITRLKILTKLDVSIRDQPQHGTCDLTIGDKQCSCEIYFAPLGDATTVLIDFTSKLGDEQAPQEIPESVQIWWQQRDSNELSSR
jgi:type IV pilus assembly protein PilB